MSKDERVLSCQHHLRRVNSMADEKDVLISSNVFEHSKLSLVSQPPEHIYCEKNKTTVPWGTRPCTK